MVRHYAGGHWSEHASREKIHVNLLSLYVDIVLRNLIAKTPRCMLSTFAMEHKPVVHAMQDWANNKIERIDLGSTLKRVGLDSLFSIGIAKVSLTTPAESALGAWDLKVGEPCVQRVDLDDWVFDHHARDLGDVGFMGHRYRVPLAAVKDSKMYHKSRKDLTASTDERFNQQGDEKINVLGRGYYGNDEEIEDMVDLWEIYCPRQRCVYTLSEDCLTGAMAPSHGGKPVALMEQDWVGPDSGPYKILGMGTVPGNPMPKGPIMNLIELHIAANRIMRKLIWSAENMKEILIAPKGADGDIERVRQSMHGDILGLDRPKDFAQVTMNMPNNMLLQFFMQIKEMFSWMAGNLEMMGGLSPQAKTARQDAMLNENASKGIADMQDRMIAFTSEVIESLLWYCWHDPQLIMKAPYSPRGLPDVQIMREVKPWNALDPRAMKRTGNWEDLQVKVDPYSLPHSTPQQRAGDLIGLVKEVWTPLAALAQQQGVVLDFNKFLEKIGQYRDMPDLIEIMSVRQPPPQTEGGPPTQTGPRPAPEETTHVRENMPGRTRQGNDMMMMNALAGVDAGGASQNGQMNGVVTP